MLSHFLSYLYPGFFVVSIMMGLFWVYAVYKKNAGVVDLGWALGLVIMAGNYYIFAPGYGLRKSLIFACVAIWGARISWLLCNRLFRHAEEDSRYQRLREGWGNHIHLKFFLLFQFEAVLSALLSIPFLIISLNERPALLPIEVLGVMIFCVGISGETLADQQLKSFKADRENKGKICQVGLWNYSRHPNYFFEWLIWVSYFLMALGSPNGWAAAVSPAIMFFLLTKVSGIPMIEEHALKTKGEAFKEYMRTTSFFVPMPKRK